MQWDALQGEKIKGKHLTARLFLFLREGCLDGTTDEIRNLQPFLICKPLQSLQGRGGQSDRGLSLKGLGGLFRHGETLSQWDARGKAPSIDPPARISKHLSMHIDNDLLMFGVVFFAVVAMNVVVLFALARLRREYSQKFDALRAEVEALKK